MLIKLDDAEKGIGAHRVYYDGTMLIEDQRYNDGLNDAIGALRALPVSDGWEDIATAPRDGTAFLAFYPEYLGHKKNPYVLNVYNAGGYLAISGGFNVANMGTPTHWRPLPAPPTIE